MMLGSLDREAPIVGVVSSRAGRPGSGRQCSHQPRSAPAPRRNAERRPLPNTVGGYAAADMSMTAGWGQSSRSPSPDCADRIEVQVVHVGGDATLGSYEGPQKRRAGSRGRPRSRGGSRPPMIRMTDSLWAKAPLDPPRPGAKSRRRLHGRIHIAAVPMVGTRGSPRPRTGHIPSDAKRIAEMSRCATRMVADHDCGTRREGKSVAPGRCARRWSSASHLTPRTAMTPNISGTRSARQQPGSLSAAVSSGGTAPVPYAGSRQGAAGPGEPAYSFFPCQKKSFSVPGPQTRPWTFLREATASTCWNMKA